jgi:hypothetical protein
MPIFRRSEFRWECERCGIPFEPGKGGVCPVCRQTLCDRHLHGSLRTKLLVSFGVPLKCVGCRAAEAGAT